ncbi:CAMK/CAMKL protein kinase [Allomyces macrogynus ATCC 38327]|uniref:non-specific serine/threonine protein kinase n=1 Tax=Allomyces macrogynus (strain ATCC 38327) TaxID=578462 RepID=A0A0L0RYD1_ALLM3|nr:CAMK/CAMKL protein kinase [Allomyces macrogynus ATCC 38327]|eukprot:KNE55363.1 CAMK/CAMKL protein kinase [Allomyces macrogynus ATCC 38327]
MHCPTDGTVPATREPVAAAGTGAAPAPAGPPLLHAAHADRTASPSMSSTDMTAGPDSGCVDADLAATSESSIDPSPEYTGAQQQADAHLMCELRRNPNEPAEIGAYKIGKTLGQGAYGKVKRGVHTTTGEEVAIKIIEKSTLRQPKEIARVQREIRYLKLIHHPHIVKVHDVHETKDQIFIVMEHVSGGELFEYIVSERRVRESEARVFYRQLLSAMHYCHVSAIVHRDLKPENLLLDANKSLRIIDFGLSTMFQPNSLLETFCGSPFYAAPEMIAGRRYEGPEVDVWSLGVILFALVCGHLPFVNENVKELYKEIATAKFNCPPHLSTEVIHLIQRMIVVDPNKRATLQEVLDHPWVNEGHAGPPPSYLPDRPAIRILNKLSPPIVARLATFGYTPAEIDAAFLAPDHTKPHPIRATYYLIFEMLRCEEKKQRDVAAATAKPAAAIAAAPTPPSQASVAGSRRNSGQGVSSSLLMPSMPQSLPPTIERSGSAVTSTNALTANTGSIATATAAGAYAAHPPSDGTAAPLTEADKQTARDHGIAAAMAAMCGSSSGSSLASDDDWPTPSESSRQPSGSTNSAPTPPSVSTLHLSRSGSHLRSGDMMLATPPSPGLGTPPSPHVNDMFGTPHGSLNRGIRRPFMVTAGAPTAAGSRVAGLVETRRTSHGTPPQSSTPPRSGDSSPRYSPTPGRSSATHQLSSATLPRSVPAPVSTAVPTTTLAQVETISSPSSPVSPISPQYGPPSMLTGRRSSAVDTIGFGDHRRHAGAPVAVDPRVRAGISGPSSLVPSRTGSTDGTTASAAIAAATAAAAAAVAASRATSTRASTSTLASTLGAMTTSALEDLDEHDSQPPPPTAETAVLDTIKFLSARSEMDIMAAFKRVLLDNLVAFTHDDTLTLRCTVLDLVFTIDVHKTERPQVRGVRMTRVTGNTWTFQHMAKRLLQQLNI